MSHHIHSDIKTLNNQVKMAVSIAYIKHSANIMGKNYHHLAIFNNN